MIVGLAHRDFEPPEKRLFSYPDMKGDPVESRHGALSAYLFDAKDVANRHLMVRSASTPLAAHTPMRMGSKPVDGGNLIFDATERQNFLAGEPGAKEFMVPFVGAQEYISGAARWILSLATIAPDKLRLMPHSLERLRQVKDFRSASKKAKTRELAAYPSHFEVTTIPENPFLAVPEVSSERRDYVPIGWLEPPTIPSNKLLVVMEAALWDFALLTSRQHMAWLAHVGGRLKSDFQYSPGMVYNTFPWPDATPAQRVKIETLAQAVLEARAAHPTSSLADLYDPDTMPGNLRKAHAALDAAVDKLYRAAPFASDRDRVEHLFGRYEALVNPLEREAAKQNRRVARKVAKQD